MIKVKPRAKISAEFIDAYRSIVEARLEQEDRKIRSLKGERRKAYLNQKKYVLGRLRAIARKEALPGQGMDLEVTRLRALGFEQFAIASFESRCFFGGITPEIVMEEVSRANRLVARWDVGRFEAYIPIEDVLSGETCRIHFIPTRERTTPYRHPHHVASPQGLNPLGFSPRTCWSDFGGPLTMALNECNIPELFRMFHIFISRYYNGSPLTSSFTTHMRRLP